MSIGLAKLVSMPAALLGLVFASTSPALGATEPAAGLALVRSNCSGCHLEHDGKFERISAMRKSPEGWSMTIFRMKHVHGVKLSDDAESGIIAYLSDTLGLAPSESAAGRFALERRPNVKDLDLGGDTTVICGRCHSLARVALQRRDAAEWLKLAHLHVGQWPSLEYQATSRDRPWWEIATKQMPPKLAALYPFESTAWSDWRKQAPRDLSGTWVATGHEPGGRDLYGTVEITRDAAGGYAARYSLTDGAGASVGGQSHAVVYTGYEWRGRGDLGGRAAREVYAMSADGSRLAGRWFDPEHPEEGGDFTAVRANGPAQVLAVLPRALKVGTTQSVTVVGVGLADNAVSFGPGVTTRVTGRAAGALTVAAAVAGDALPGARSVSAGPAQGANLVAVYRQIDHVEVQPSYGIARLGGGKIKPVTAQFVAIGETRLADGSVLSLGPVAAEWHAEPFDDEAKRTDDPKFAGTLESNGRFMPAGAGPNKVREFSGNNVGNLSIVARVRDGERTLDGAGHLIVTVQRWNTPPIY